MTYGVDYLNLEYILTRTFGFLSGAPQAFASVPHWISSTAQVIIFVGMAATLILLLLTVYAQIRLVQVEHEGFHAKEEAEHERAAHTQEASPTNERWRRIVELAQSPHDSDWRQAILEADIMLSAVFEAHGYTGDTVGDQFSMVNKNQVTTLDLAREAHKVRNVVAHLGEGYPLTEREVKATIENYRRVFEELGAI